jgi:hypothetical protein
MLDGLNRRVEEVGIMFKTNFDDFVCEGDVIQTTVEGFTVYAQIKRDEDSHINDDDCHNIDQSVTGCSDEQYKKLLEARQAWENDEWFYCGVVLSVQKGDIVLQDHAVSLWRIEANYPGSDNAYLTEVANDLLDEAIAAGKAALKTLID